MSGPSGAGKGTLCRTFLRRHPKALFSVSYTTRPIRPGEVDGVDYRFVDDATFRSVERSGGFIETTEIYGNRYGTPREPIDSRLASGHDVVVDVDTDGGKWFRRAYPDAVFIFVVAPSQRVLRQRLIRRGVVDEEELSRRLNGGAREMMRAEEYDYLVVNDRLSQSIAALEAIVHAERCRMSRRREWLAKIR